MMPIARFAAAFALTLLPSTALAWDETVDGDLSSDPAAPTQLDFAVGNNVISGSVTTTAPVDTRDYVRFTIAPGQHLTALRVVRWVNLPDNGSPNRGFHAINAGETSFIPSSATAESFLAGDHFDPVAPGTDVLPELADGDSAGPGFSVPLGPGTYCYVVQQTGPQLNGYTLQFVVTGPAAAAVPAWPPWMAALSAGLLLGAGFWLQRRRAREHDGVSRAA